MSPDRVRAFRIPGLSAVVVWLGIANALLFAFMAIVARILNPPDYGLFASVFGLVALMNVLFSGVQAAAAASVAGLPAEERRDVLRTRWRTIAAASLVLLCCLLALSPAISTFLHASSILAVVAAACFITALLPWAFLLGAFQGSMRFHEFGLLTFAGAAMRIFAIVALLVDRSPTVVLWAMVATAVPPIVLGVWLYQRNPTPAAVRKPEPRPRANLIDRQLGLAILVAVTVGFPTVGDVILVRHLYSAEVAGLYAGVALTGRVVLFLAFAVTTVSFPAFVASAAQDRTRLLQVGLGAIAILTFPAALLISMAPLTVLTAVLGPGYAAAVPLVPYYATAAVLFSVAALYAFYHLARSNTRHLLGTVLPFLVLQAAAPFVVAPDIARLLVVNVVIAASFALVSIAVTHSPVRAATRFRR